jgi:hypothetical protein
MRDGCVLTLALTQDGTGGRTVTWSGVTWGSAGAPVLSTGIGAEDVLTFVKKTGKILGLVSGYGF